MSAVERLVDADALIPDGIEPVEGLRCWIFDLDGKLKSLTNGEVWTPGEPLTARCMAGNGKTYSWDIVRRGMTREEAWRCVRSHNRRQETFLAHDKWEFMPDPPKTELPDGYGLDLAENTHNAPHENCTCGIYAATTKEQLPGSGHVYGKVKLWGKVVPGSKGVRAQFAYPSEFHVHPSMLDNPTLKAFGVPLVAKDDAPLPASAGGLKQLMSTNTGAATFGPAWSRTTRLLILANVGGCLLNLSVVGWHVLH